MSNRIFSEDEVQKLIKRAAELEAERSVSDNSNRKNGLTMGELKAVASEAGLNPQLIERAAAELDDKSTDLEEIVQVNREEIVSEIWLDRQPDRETMDLLVTELNHIYGTTDDLNWWDNLWGTHEGKAKVRRTSNTTQWNYKTEAGMYSTRVLMQQHGERFRIRVSKRQLMDLEWDSTITSMILVIPIAALLGVLGGISSSNIFGTAWPGTSIGLMISLFGYPLIRRFTKRFIEKHKTEVANTTRQLTELVSQSVEFSKDKKTEARKNRSASIIEIPDEQEATESQSDKLRNDLRE